MRHWLARAVLRMAVLLACAPPVLAGDAGERVLDDFASLAPWRIQSTDQVKATLRAEAGAMCIDYDFNGVSGYAAATRSLPITFPAQYALRLQVRGTGPANHLQLKLVDGSGENVWWQNKADFVPSPEWTAMVIKKRHLSFAWGPSADHQLRTTASLELVVAAGKDGGSGTLCFDDFRLQTIDAAALPPAAPRAEASSGDARLAIDGRRDTVWRTAAGAPQWLTLDFGYQREFGGLVLHWAGAQHAQRYQVQLSDDGRQWRTVRHVDDGDGGSDWLDLPESDSRYLRLQLEQGPQAAFALGEIEIKPIAFAATPNDFMRAVARAAPRGLYPRAYLGQQTYWTLLGIDGGPVTGLIGEDGAIESRPGGFSVEPFIVGEHGLVSWANVQARQTLPEGYLPMPRVTWRHKDLTLEVAAFATGTAAQSQVLARYTVSNVSGHRIKRTLALAVRPYQVNPPSQFLNTTGGVSPIWQLDWRANTLTVNRQPGLQALTAPARFVAGGFDSGNIAARLAGGAPLPDRTEWADAGGRAEGALLYPVDLAPGASTSVVIALPLTGELAPMVQAGDVFAAQEALAAAQWREKLNRVTLRLLPSQQHQFDVMRSALAHMLMSRAGPALQPGTRSYARSWVRDGVMMGEGLLRLGHPQVASDFVEWFAPYQFANGKVPCCVDRRGADPVPENDSHGQLIFGIAQLYRHTGDLQQLRRLWPHVEQAIAYMEQLRKGEQGPAQRGTALYGLMPASISHEGYSAKPMHSYWDDFWALRGFKDAAALAAVAGPAGQAQRYAALRDAFQADLKASIAAALQQHRIAFVPGAAELGDFDATSTTMALAPAQAQDIIAPAALAATFERYWKQFTIRRDGGKQWEDYTPYELRVVGSFVRLGMRDRAQQALAYFYRDLRPAGWNQWAEVVGRVYRKERFIGDMPHAWISSDYLRSVLDVYAWEDEHAQQLVLASGIPPAWLAGEGVAVTGMRTTYGPLTFALSASQAALALRVDGGLTVPPGGLVYRPPFAGKAWRDASGDGWTFSGGVLHISSLPAEVRLSR